MVVSVVSCESGEGVGGSEDGVDTHVETLPEQHVKLAEPSAELRAYMQVLPHMSYTLTFNP